ncbi:MAG: amino acid ABC transporter substrate-binding protein [Minwuia sp.]|nr:amino acid ABC transporter substrate-binding protein [Minwuia sp.]
MSAIARSRSFTIILALVLMAAALPAQRVSAGEVLDRIRADGVVRCGVTASGIGLSEIGDTGSWEGFFYDFCRALASAVLNEPDAIEPVEVDDVIRFKALADGAFDVLMANTTWTIGRDTAMGITFADILLYDGQAFLAHRSIGAESLAAVKDGTVCVPGGTTTVKNLSELSAGLDGRIKAIEFNSTEALYDAFFSRRCDIITYDMFALASLKQTRANSPDDLILFPEIISKEPLSSVIRRGDDEWFHLVRWASRALIAAEELGVTQANVDSMRRSDLPEVRRLLGVDARIGEDMGLTNEWAYQMIRDVGNYGEIYERHFGAAGLNIPRGLNALWRDGGLHYAPPIR